MFSAERCNFSSLNSSLRRRERDLCQKQNGWRTPPCSYLLPDASKWHHDAGLLLSYVLPGAFGVPLWDPESWTRSSGNPLCPWIKALICGRWHDPDEICGIDKKLKVPSPFCSPDLIQLFSSAVPILGRKIRPTRTNHVINITYS